MKNQNQFCVDDGQHHSHWNEECVHGNVSILWPTNDGRESYVHGAKPSETESQHGRHYKGQNSDKDGHCMKNVLSPFLPFQLLEVEWHAYGKEGVTNLYGNPYSQWVDYVA